jgi:hypothetical protein
VLDGLITPLRLLTRHNGRDQIDFKIKIFVTLQQKHNHKNYKTAIQEIQ